MTQSNKERITVLFSEEKKNILQKFIIKNNIPTISMLVRRSIDFYIENLQTVLNLPQYIQDIKENLTSIKGFSQILLDNNWNRIDLDIVLKLKEIYEACGQIEEKTKDFITEGKNINKDIDFLIVENNNSILNIFIHYFKQKGHTYKWVSLGVEAIRILQKISPRVILLDIDLPDINGYDICKSIKDDKKLKNIPIFFITAKLEKEVRVLITETGAEGYFLKPFDLDEFSILNNFLY